MTSCYICENHRQQGARHSCIKCKNKIVYGDIQEKFLTPCLYFRMTAAEERRRNIQQENERPQINEKMRLKKSEVMKWAK